MKSFFEASALRHCTFLLTIVFITCASSSSAQKPAWATARDFRLRIETDHSDYHVGDSILVRLTLLNVSSHTVAFFGASATGLTQLLVSSEDGHRIGTTLPRVDHIWWGRTCDLDPGQEVGLPGQERTNRGELTGRGLVWVNLRYWGYDIRSPGEYTIVGMPLVFEVNPEHPRSLLGQDTTVRSNEAKFTIQAK
jgi:hypothetical protein